MRKDIAIQKSYENVKLSKYFSETANLRNTIGFVMLLVEEFDSTANLIGKHDEKLEGLDIYNNRELYNFNFTNAPDYFDKIEFVKWAKDLINEIESKFKVEVFKPIGKNPVRGLAR